MVHLRSGGFIATYRCTAACKHCLYASSPKREKDYVTKGSARESLAFLRAHGCGGLHIGGGEPFLSQEGLIDLMREFHRANMRIDYVETNGFWAKGDQRDDEFLKRFMDEGLDTLMLSLCPFHDEFVPMQKVQNAVDACHRNGVQVFVWQEQFAQRILRTGDPSRTHTLEEYERANPGGVALLPEQFGLRIGGRASITYADRHRAPVERLIREASPCDAPLHTGHFHVDCFGDFIPPACPGIAFPLQQIDTLEEAEIPAIQLLAQEGCGALAEAAIDLGFQPNAHYLDECALCQHARAYLCQKQPERWTDLRPAGFYQDLYGDLE